MTRSTSGSASGHDAASITWTFTPRPAEQLARDPPVVAVVAAPGDHRPPSAVDATEHVDRRTGNRPACAVDQFVDRDGRSGIDGRHLLRREDRDHSAKPRRSAIP